MRENSRTAGAPALRVISGHDRFEMGRSAAEAAGARALAFTRWLSRQAGRDPDHLRNILSEARSRMRRMSDDGSFAELEGLGRGLGIDPHDALCARVAAESCARLGCTNFGATGPATADGEPFISWNFDVPPVFRLFMGHFPLFVRRLEGSNPYVCLGVPALFGIGIMNRAGLCCVVNAVPMTDAGEGLSPFELNNTAMETCGAVDEAASVCGTGPRKSITAIGTGVLMNWNMIWADMQGSLAVFEASHSHFHREDAGPDKVIASTNHHQFIDPSLTGCPDPTELELIAGSYSRLERMWSLIRACHGRIDPVAAKAIVSDHVPDYSTLRQFGIRREWWQQKIDDSTVCAHNWNWKKHLLAGEMFIAFQETLASWTVYSLQLQPAGMTVWVTDGHPCRNPSSPVYFGEALGSDAPPHPGALTPRELGGGKPQEKRWGLFRTGMGPLEKFMTGAWMGFVDASEKMEARYRSRS